MSTSSSFFPDLPLTPSPPIRSILRIYVANLITSEFGVESFTRQTIDCIVMYMYKFIVSMMIKVRTLLGNKGRVVGNYLHVVHVWEDMGYHIGTLIQFLGKRCEKNSSRDENTIRKFDIKKLITKQNNLFEHEIPDTAAHPNIIKIPLNYLTIQQIQQQPLPIRQPIPDNVNKPPIYSYSKQEIFMQKNYEHERIARQAIYSEKEMKVAMMRNVHKKRKLNEDELKDKLNKSTKPIENYANDVGYKKMSFSLCKYL